MANETTSIEEVRLRPHFSDLTTGQLNGFGLFDELMQTVKQHLLEEYSTQRIKGAEYSKVYLGSMEATLQNAVQYLLGIGTLDLQLKKLEKENELLDLQKDLVGAQVKKVDAEILQIECQTEQCKAQTDSIKAQTDLIKAQKTTETSLLPGRVNELTRKGELLKSQAQQSDAETAMINWRLTNLLPQEKLLLQAQTGRETAQTSEIDYRVSNILPAEKEKINNDADVSKNQASKLSMETNTLLVRQSDKLNAEKYLIDAKAQVEDRQLDVFSAQINQLNEQASAFDKEIAVKKEKIHADAWSAKAVADGSGAGGPPSWT